MYVILVNSISSGAVEEINSKYSFVYFQVLQLTMKSLNYERNNVVGWDLNRFVLTIFSRILIGNSMLGVNISEVIR